MRSLVRDVRSEQNIFTAWRHVKKSALTSGNPNIRGKASEFEHQHQKHLRRIIAQLRGGRFIFDPVEGVLKDRRKREAQNKAPRPIAIATLTNRVVQRAILQVLQPRVARDLRGDDPKFETKVDPRLGRINDVNRSRFGVGGLIHPYGGVRPAITTIMAAMDAGARYYFQSDIKAFFTKIPTAQVIEFVGNETNDHDLTELFAKALDVHLANKDELQGYAELFPHGGIGVAQGSSLSAFAGNVLLYDLDHELNSMGVTAVRYIDDILMVSSNQADLDAAVQHAANRLKNLGFGLYSPDNSDKAAQGECSSSISFLGCGIQPKRCVPSAASVAKIKEAVRESLSSSKGAIKDVLRTGGRLNPRLSQTCTIDTISKRIYGWQKSFAFCNDGQAFRALDGYVADQVRNYQQSVLRILDRASLPTQMMILGVPSTFEMFQAGGIVIDTPAGANSSASWPARGADGEERPRRPSPEARVARARSRNLKHHN